jgi:hypothetical protein
MSRWLALLLLGTAACGHTHSARNAPGNIDVRRPPAEITKKTVEEPGDPGEQAVVVAAGALGGGGIAFGGDEDARGAYGAGPELSLGYGTSDRSHADDDFFMYPQRSLGTNLGWTPLTGEGSGVGPLYAELYYSEVIVWLGGGWAWDPDDQRHGPQLTLTMMVLYVRATHLFDQGTQITGGISLKLPHAFVWSR